jgi:hypothetical protein
VTAVQFSRARTPGDLASQVLALKGPHTVYADPETAHALDILIRSAGQQGRLTVCASPGLHKGHAIVSQGAMS